eukprot:SAG31_NODE_1787_length_7268_cov_6.628679_4_plen_129_part_00
MAPLSEPLAPPSAEAVAATNGRNIAILTVGFFFLFSSYNTLQGYVTTTQPDRVGFMALALLYTSYELFIPFAPAICNRIGDKAAMVTGGCCYALFSASLMLSNRIGAAHVRKNDLLKISRNISKLCVS